MVRQLKEVELLTRHQGGGGVGGWVEEFASVVYMLCAVLVTLSLFAAIIFFCADGISKDSTKDSGTTVYANGSACAAAGCGAACGGGCGG